MRAFARKSKTPQQADKSVMPGRASREHVPSVVRHVLASPGQSLDSATRRLMEPRFGHDFSRVRVHHDSLASESAEAVDARAYTVGDDIVFGRDEYQPETEQGRSLLAHELTHVVQQRNVNTAAGGSVRLGDPSDDAERQAEVVDPHPVLRRTCRRPSGSASSLATSAQVCRSWAGKFIADPYYPQSIPGEQNKTGGYGAHIEITFKPNPLVDAEEIAFVQIAQTVQDENIVNIYQEKGQEESEAEERRTIPEGMYGAGYSIDAFPRSRTPLIGVADSQGADLAKDKSETAIIGSHYTDTSGKLRDAPDAWMCDEPKLTTGDAQKDVSEVQTKEWSQRFETTALAISGNQKGTFYGSVEWGWSKKAEDRVPHLLEFKTKSESVPSQIFMEAASLWNKSISADNREPIEVPLDVLRTASKDTVMWDSPDRRTKVATLAKGTPLALTRITEIPFFSPKSWAWTKATVIGGQHARKTGWILETDLSQPWWKRSP